VYVNVFLKESHSVRSGVETLYVRLIDIGHRIQGCRRDHVWNQTEISRKLAPGKNTPFWRRSTDGKGG